MSIVVDAASASFSNGFSCSQAVLEAFCGKYGLDRQTALRISGCFGSGMQAADICGAVSGAVMVIGLKDGYTDPENKDAKFFAQGRTGEFLSRFRARHGALACRDLLGCDITTPEGKRVALSGNFFTTLCPAFVVSAAALLEEMGY